MSDSMSQEEIDPVHSGAIDNCFDKDPEERKACLEAVYKCDGEEMVLPGSKAVSELDPVSTAVYICTHEADSAGYDAEFECLLEENHGDCDIPKDEACNKAFPECMKKRANFRGKKSWLRQFQNKDKTPYLMDTLSMSQEEINPVSGAMHNCMKQFPFDSEYQEKREACLEAINKCESETLDAGNKEYMDCVRENHKDWDEKNDKDCHNVEHKARNAAFVACMNENENVLSIQTFSSVSQPVQEIKLPLSYAMSSNAAGNYQTTESSPTKSLSGIMSEEIIDAFRVQSIEDLETEHCVGIFLLIIVLLSMLCCFRR